jgi:enamine deaminase RidA (YjgF/YER057c/UK114 family)
VSQIEARAEQLGYSVPAALPVHGRYSSVLIDQGLAYASGVVGVVGDPPKLAFPGRVGAEVSIDDAKESARLAFMTMLGNLREALGNLDRIDHFLKLTGYVSTVPGTPEIHRVIGAASELLAEIIGADRLPARTVVGAAELPGGASVALDATLRLRPDERS